MVSKPRSAKSLLTVTAACAGLLALMACSPTVKIEAPSEPIYLKVDVNIKQEVLLKVQDDVQDVSVTPAIPLAKRAGWIGERLDGYLGLVQDDAPSDIQDLVLSANEDRRTRYADIASRHNTKVELVEVVAGKKFIKESAPGEFVETTEGTWARK